MNFFLATLPITLVLCLILFFHWRGPQAGLAGWVCGFVIALLAFGLNWQVLWVSQIKGLLVAVNSLMLLWPALFLYFLVDGVGGISAIALALQNSIKDRGILLVTMAWAFASLVEGVAGFGMPIAILAPLLLALGVSPLIAVAAPAIGHSWAVTFGGMGIVYQVLTGVTAMDPGELAPWVLLLDGVACLACGFSAAALLRQLHHWKAILAIGLTMIAGESLTVLVGLRSLGTFMGAAAGLGMGILLGRHGSQEFPTPNVNQSAYHKALLAYGLAISIAILIGVFPQVNNFLGQVALIPHFPQVATETGSITQAGSGQIIRPLIHQGIFLLLSALISYRLWRVRRDISSGTWRAAFTRTVRAAAPPSLTILTMVGLAQIMEHTGMTMLLARGLIDVLGPVYPLASPLVGILGAFTTGSNNNSNVLFGMVQKNTALLLGAKPEVLVAAQTIGGGLGSMLAPAKIIVGCSTIGQQKLLGEVLRKTIPVGILVGLTTGLLALGLSLLV